MGFQGSRAPLLVLALFAASAWLRSGRAQSAQSALAVALELAALLAGTVGACMGSTLLEQLRLQVHRITEPAVTTGRGHDRVRLVARQNATRGQNAAHEKLDFPVVRAA